METLTIKTEQISNNLEFEGLDLTSQRENLSKFYGIPMALANVDKKFKTHTFSDVLKQAAPYIEVMVKDDNVQVRDPRSVYMDDDQFDEIIERVSTITGLSPKISEHKFERSAKFDAQVQTDDNYLGDVFSKHFDVTRRPEGGLQVGTSLVRLSCSNGMTVPEKQYNTLIRNSVVAENMIPVFVDSVNNFKIGDYFNTLFTDNGEEVPCYLSDMSEMHQCLANLTTPEYADMLFPMKSVELFYNTQNIEVSKLSLQYKSKLPTGLSYYQAFNILTNGAKSMTDPTIDNQVKVARFCTRRRLSFMKSVDLHWKGAPQFTKDQLSFMMGDKR